MGGGKRGKRCGIFSLQHSCSYKCQHEIGLEKDPERFGSRNRRSFNKAPLRQGQNSHWARESPGGLAAGIKARAAVTVPGTNRGICRHRQTSLCCPWKGC